MSRSGYSEEMDDQWGYICWRGAVKSAIKGRRGQAFLSEMGMALDALPQKRLIAGELEAQGDVCALGAVGRLRGIDMAELDPVYPETFAAIFGIARALACEIVFMNDEGTIAPETPEQRWARVRGWVKSCMKERP